MLAIVGVDAHKRSRTFVAIDQSGRKLAAPWCGRAASRNATSTAAMDSMADSRRTRSLRPVRPSARR